MKDLFFLLYIVHIWFYIYYLYVYIFIYVIFCLTQQTISHPKDMLHSL